MRKDTGDELEQDARRQHAPAKRPYVKPAFRYERVFETMALACGKIDDTQLQCHTIIKLS